MPKNSKPKKGVLVVISGPSGVGKSTVVQRLIKQNPKFRMSVSATTRAPRPAEKNGADYFFLSKKEFFGMADRGEFLEWAEVHNHYYGTSRKTVQDELDKDKVVILEVDVQGAASIKEMAQRGRIRAGASVFIFLIPPSVDMLAFRLKKRKTEDPEVMNYRLRAAIAELQVMEKYDYIVVNDRVEEAADKIRAIINVERERTLLN